MASSAPHYREDERASSPGHFKHGHRAVCNGVLISSFLDILGSWSWFLRCSGLGCRAVVLIAHAGGVGQLGMAHRSDGPASSLRMFGHVHRAMCGGGCQFEVLEEYVGARMGVGGASESVGGALERVGGRRRSSENVGEGRCCRTSALV